MPSEPTNQSQNLVQSQPSISQPVTIATRPQVDEIQRGFIKAETPMDFINKNLQRLAAAGVDPAHAVAAPAPEQAPIAEPAVPPAEPAILSPVEPPVEPSEEPIAEDAPAQTLQENIKNARKSINEFKTKLHEKETELKTVTEERDKYRTGEVLPDKVKDLEAKVQTLSKYQALVELEVSPEYQEKYVKPLSEIRNKLSEIGKDYEIPDEVINEALQFTNQRDLNQFLSEHFDAVGAMDVKNLVNQAKSVQKEAEIAKGTPKEALNRLIAEGEQARDNRIAQQRSRVASKATDSWVKSLDRIQQEKNIPELTIKENDKQHNEEVAIPLRSAAATEYGKIISKLVDAGLEKLPDDLSDAIASMVVLAVASGVTNAQRNEAVRRYNNIEENSRRETQYGRPPIGASFGTGGGVVTPKQLPTVEVAARNLLADVVANRQNRGLAPK